LIKIYGEINGVVIQFEGRSKRPFLAKTVG